MRLEVTLPDSLLSGAERAAAASGISLEAYVAEAVQLHLQDGPADEMTWFFTPQRISEIREASEGARNGDGISLEKFKAERNQWRAEWQANHRG